MMYKYIQQLSDKIVKEMFHHEQMQAANNAVDIDDSLALEAAIRKMRMPCYQIEGLLDRAAAKGKLASISTIIDMLETRGCPLGGVLDAAAKEAVIEGEFGAVLFLIARGATNYDELIDVAENTHHHYIATLIKQKIGRIGGYRY